MKRYCDRHHMSHIRAMSYSFFRLSGFSVQCPLRPRAMTAYSGTAQGHEVNSRRKRQFSVVFIDLPGRAHDPVPFRRRHHAVFFTEMPTMPLRSVAVIAA